jgi:ubiquinone/menaquinone biosynthesis C-methylase UbiE
MEVEGEVARHYAHSDLTATVLAALRGDGKDTDALTTADLGGVDEFHLGWGPQTVAFAKTLGLKPGMAVLDVGSGIGGPARHFAEAYGCEVTGIDLTPAFVELANELTARTGLAGHARFVNGSALAMPFETASFDLATMIHVGMNIGDKPALFREVRRVLRPGGRFVVYDVMRAREGDLPMPMPWAETLSTSFVETPGTYRALLEAAGFRVTQDRDWTAFVLEAAAKLRERAATAGAPAAGLQLLMGPTGMEQLHRVAGCVKDGLLAPIEIDATAT